MRYLIIKRIIDLLLCFSILPFSVSIEKSTNVIAQKPQAKINLQSNSKIGRNDPCPCGSGKKYKKCFGSIDCGL